MIALQINTADLLALTETLRRKLTPRALPRTVADVGIYLGAQAKRRFDEGVGPDGVAWVPLKQPRNRSRDRRGARAGGGSGQKPLRDSGRLMASTTGAASILETGPLHVVQGTNLEYAAVHQFGVTMRRPARRAPTRSGRPFWSFLSGAGDRIYTRRIREHTITIPARPFLGINERDVYRIQQITLDNLLRGVP